MVCVNAIQKILQQPSNAKLVCILGPESPLLGRALPPNDGLPSANSNLVGLQCGYRTPDEKPKKKVGILVRYV